MFLTILTGPRSVGDFAEHVNKFVVITSKLSLGNEGRFPISMFLLLKRIPSNHERAECPRVNNVCIRLPLIITNQIRLVSFIEHFRKILMIRLSVAPRACPDRSIKAYAAASQLARCTMNFTELK